MSETELNKGRLVPVEESELQFIAVKNSLTVEEILDESCEYGIYQIKGNFYRIELEIDGRPFYDDFCEIEEKEDGTLDFTTIHYNGGGHFTEVLEYGWDKRKAVKKKD